MLWNKSRFLISFSYRVSKQVWCNFTVCVKDPFSVHKIQIILICHIMVLFGQYLVSRYFGLKILIRLFAAIFVRFHQNSIVGQNFLGHTVVVMAQQFETSLQPLFSRDKISRLLQSSKMWALIYLGLLLLLFKAIQAQDFVSLKIVLKLWLVIFMLVDLECKKC